MSAATAAADSAPSEAEIGDRVRGAPLHQRLRSTPVLHWMVVGG